MENLDILTELEERYLEAKEAYYTGSQLMTDDEFDLLEEKLKELGSTKIIVGFSNLNANKEYHLSSMLSLGKVQVRGQVEDIKKHITEFKSRSAGPLECTPKLDGNAINVIYKGGIYHKAITRGDKTKGQDVTQKIRPLVPATIPFTKTLEIRGEVLMPIETFNAKYASEFKNSRNFIAGTINRKSDDGVINPILLNKEAKFVPFEVRVHDDQNLGWSFMENSMSWLKQNKFDIIEPFYVSNFDEFVVVYKQFEAFRSTYKYQLDGLVLKAKENERKSIGEDSTTPKWAMAIKFPPKETYTTILDVRWKTGSSGEVVPLAILDPVDLDGSTISRCAMYNYGWMIKNKCYAGATVQLVKSGDIIPQIVKVITPSTKIFITPTSCTSCGHNLTIDGVHLECRNSTCEAQLLSKFAKWCAVLEIDGLGGSTVKLIYDSGINTPESFIKNFNRTYLINSGYFKEGKTLDKLLYGWSSVKEIESYKIIYAFALNGGGNSMSKQIAFSYNNLPTDFKGLEKAVVEELLSDKYISRYFSIVESLKEIGKTVFIKSTGESIIGKIKVELTGKPSQSNNIKTKSDLITLMHNFNYVHTDLKEADILLTDDLSSTSSKMKFAKTKNIKIMTYNDFYELLINLKTNPL